MISDAYIHIGRAYGINWLCMYGVKVNGQYYREDLLMQKLLPDIRQLSDFYVFQQDSAPVHRARETIELLTMEPPEFIPPTLWPPNTPDLNPVDYKVWSIMQDQGH